MLPETIQGQYPRLAVVLLGEHSTERNAYLLFVTVGSLVLLIVPDFALDIFLYVPALVLAVGVGSVAGARRYGLGPGLLASALFVACTLRAACSFAHAYPGPIALDHVTLQVGTMTGVVGVTGFCVGAVARVLWQRLADT